MEAILAPSSQHSRNFAAIVNAHIEYAFEDDAATTPCFCLSLWWWLEILQADGVLLQAMSAPAEVRRPYSNGRIAGAAT